MGCYFFPRRGGDNEGVGIDERSRPGFPIWVPSMCPNPAGILAETQIPVFTRRVPRDRAARLRLRS